ncbi:MAG: hypothetical protein WDZ69_00155 [Candidatus Pacearchaeota archaeon]
MEEVYQRREFVRHYRDYSKSARRVKKYSLNAIIGAFLIGTVIGYTVKSCDVYSEPRNNKEIQSRLEIQTGNIFEVNLNDEINLESQEREL